MRLLYLLVALLLTVAAPADARKRDCDSAASIGVATMTPDGEITLRIRSLPPGPIAEGTLRYKSDDPKYQEIKAHLGGIAPGETKPVRPWCGDAKP